jgi:hypothetical protein
MKYLHILLVGLALMLGGCDLSNGYVYAKVGDRVLMTEHTGWSAGKPVEAIIVDIDANRIYFQAEIDGKTEWYRFSSYYVTPIGKKTQ